MYDFDTIFSRRKIGAAKWDTIETEMGKNSSDIIPLSVADMEFKTAPEIVEILKDRVSYASYGYTIPTDSYYESVVNWMKKRHSWNIKKEWISLSPGIVPAFYTAIRAFTHPGDKIIIQQPVYYPFKSAAICNGCEIVNNELIYEDGKYTIDFEDLEEKVKDPRVKVLLFCNPHNPVGRVWTKEELIKVGEICLKNDVLIISDEIHFDFVYKPYKHTVFASISKELENNVITMTAPSKTFNLAGLQDSNIIIPNGKLKLQFDIANCNTGFFTLNQFAFDACEAAYNKCELWLEELLDYLQGNLNYLNNFIENNIPEIKVVPPEGTYLVWLDCMGLGMNAAELERFMKEKARIFFDEGYVFGDAGVGFERINIACPRKMMENALNNLLKAFKDIRRQG